MQVEELDSPNALPPKTPPPNYGQATALPPKPRFAAMLPPDEPAPELDETTKQQLRAVFASCDEGDKTTLDFLLDLMGCKRPSFSVYFLCAYIVPILRLVCGP